MPLSLRHRVKTCSSLNYWHKKNALGGIYVLFELSDEQLIQGMSGKSLLYPWGYNRLMEYEIITTSVFSKWIKGVKDHAARKAILARFDRIATGTFGEYKSVANGVSELKVRLGKGYRVYFTIKEQTVVVLLCGGEKSTQSKDIALAKKLKATL